MNAKWRFLLILLLAFVVWTLLLAPLLPLYARAVAPVAQWAAQVIRPHGAHIAFTHTYPHVRWEVAQSSRELNDGCVSFRLLSYNVILYLSLLTAIPRLRLKHRAVLLLTGLPLFFTFHAVDLLLTVESRLLTDLQPQHYAFWRSFDLWFVAVKFYGSFSAMALKQIFPLIVIFLQWHGLRRFRCASPGSLPATPA